MASILQCYNYSMSQHINYSSLPREENVRFRLKSFVPAIILSVVLVVIISVGVVLYRIANVPVELLNSLLFVILFASGIIMALIPLQVFLTLNKSRVIVPIKYRYQFAHDNGFT